MAGGEFMRIFDHCIYWAVGVSVSVGFAIDKAWVRGVL